jgi:uncharacterized membrane protein
MKLNDFVSKLDDRRIVAAIAESERHTSGQIRVFISEKQIEENAYERAKARFLKLGMEKTRHRNAVLIYFAPRSHKFAVVGDIAVHERCGDDFWRQLIQAMGENLKARHFTEAVVLAVEKCGALLAAHFPPEPGGTDELPNQVERD